MTYLDETAVIVACTSIIASFGAVATLLTAFQRKKQNFT